MFDATPSIVAENRAPADTREARLDALRQFYSNPRLGEPSAFGESGLALSAPNIGPTSKWQATIDAKEETAKEETENGFFTVDRIEFTDDTKIGSFAEYLER